MALQKDRTDAGREPISPGHTPRLRLKPEAAPSGYVDGAWWPRSNDLTVELPDLLAVLAARLGPIERVLYKFGDWATAPAKLVTGGRAVRLDGYRLQPPGTIEVLGLNHNRVVLLVVPPYTEPDHAYTTVTAAAGRGNESSIGGLIVADESPASAQTACGSKRSDSNEGARARRFAGESTAAPLGS
ncbi:MAG: DUF5994 family protein [Mycobacterium sp.]|nr:DUF5994 family protein [Mycobacterium sp.]